MSNYYEILGLDSNVSIDVIEAKLDEQYAKWRALVTHHDSEIASQASKAIQTIEQARNVLTDPAKKQAYDRDLQAKLATMGGLVDPSVVGQVPMGQPNFGMVMPRRPMMGGQQKPQVERLDAWICSKCQRPNPKGTTFCVKCGAVVGVNCPSCGVLGDYSDQFCSECGKDKKAVFEENKAMRLKELNDNISKLENDISFAMSDPRGYAKSTSGKKTNSGCNVVSIVIVSGFLISVGIGFLNKDWVAPGILLILAPILILGIQFLSQANNTKKQVARQIETMEGYIRQMKDQTNQIRQEKY